MTKYSDGLANEICEAIANSSYGLRRLCISNTHWPHRATIMRWLASNEIFRIKYQAAKELQADYLVDEMVEIADDSREDELLDKHGNTYMNKEFVKRSELRVRTREIVAKMLAPRKYGSANEMKLAELGKKLEDAINGGK